MKIINKVELKLEEYEKCHAIVDSDCPLGQLYDFSCSFKHFVIQKMKEAEELEKKKLEPKDES